MLVLCCACGSKKQDYKGWDVYGGNKENNHYSALTQFDTNNVMQLKVAWEYHTLDADTTLSQIQVNPILDGGTLYGVSPKLKLFALDAISGNEKWVFDPVDPSATEQKGKGYFAFNVCKGVALYKEDNGDKKIFYSASSSLYCIDAKTGRPVRTFGNEGKIDLHDNIDRYAGNLYVASTTLV